jgi:hypothetical protein
MNHQDTVELEVAYVGNRELFARPAEGQFAEQAISKYVSSGTIGNGAFGIHAAAIFAGNAATFNYRGTVKKDGHKTFRYDYEVPLEKSHFQVRHDSAEGIVGYKGSFWVDAGTLDLVRVELKAEHIPSYIGISMIEEIMQYQQVHVGNSDFLLPLKSEQAAVEASGIYFLNMITMENCHEFAGESVVKFGAPVNSGSADRAAPEH